MLAPGEFTRATESLEATLAIHPTLVLTNALPYVIDVIVWQVETSPSIKHHSRTFILWEIWLGPMVQ